MTGPTVPSQPPAVPVGSAAAFVRAVRLWLDDLPPDVVEELVGGLEADLEDSLADAGPSTAARLLEDPWAYGAELRSSAGLPPRGAVPQALPATPARSRLRLPTLDDLRDDVRQAATPVTSATWWPAVREFLLVVRPAWWVLRGALVGWLLAGRSGLGVASFLVMTACAVLSVQIGRGAWLPTGPWRPRGVVAANALALLLVPFALATATAGDSYVYVDEAGSSNGLSYNGSPVGNIYPYDAQGRPLLGVQLFDQDGRPIDLQPGSTTTERDGRYFTTVPGHTTDGVERLNIVPLAERGESTYDDDGTEHPGTLRGPRPPLVAVPPVVVPFSPPSASPSPTSSPTGSPTSAPTESRAS